jgi:hypothetical protein
MMLAEIGLPRVDVDVASLRSAPVMKFDVTPDRASCTWPQAGTDFNFAHTSIENQSGDPTFASVRLLQPGRSRVRSARFSVKEHLGSSSQIE